MESGYKVVYYAPKDIRVEPFGEVPTPNAGEVVVRVEACAICGSDVKTYLNGNPRMRPPAVIGHEFCGTIQSTGSGVTEYKTGDRVTMATTMGCGECVYCREGKTNLCKNVQAMGFHVNGAMASYTVIPAKAIKNLAPVGDLEAEIAALSEPMSCVVNSLGRVPMDNVKSAVVIGVGALGMMHAIVAREYGVPNIVCVSNPGVKRDLMIQAGFDKIVTNEELEKDYLQLSGGDGFDLVIITAPSNSIQCEAIKYARKGGYVSYFASLPVGNEMITINSRTLHYGELVCYGTSDSTVEHVKEAVKVLKSKKELIKKIITILPLKEFDKGIEGILSKKYAKVVLVP